MYAKNHIRKLDDFRFLGRSFESLGVHVFSRFHSPNIREKTCTPKLKKSGVARDSGELRIRQTHQKILKTSSLPDQETKKTAVILRILKIFFSANFGRYFRFN